MRVHVPRRHRNAMLSQGPSCGTREMMFWEVLDKSAKVEWNYLSQRRADAVVQRLEQIATPVLQPYKRGA